MYRVSLTLEKILREGKEDFENLTADFCKGCFEIFRSTIKERYDLKVPFQEDRKVTEGWQREGRIFEAILRAKKFHVKLRRPPLKWRRRAGAGLPNESEGPIAPVVNDTYQILSVLWVGHYAS